MYYKKDIIISLIIKIIAVAASVFALILTTHRLKSFSYFTVLSNVAIDLVLLIFIIADLRLLKNDGRIKTKTNLMYTIKYVFTVSITITFLVFMFVLAPTEPGGFLNAYFDYYNSSFCLHFLTPLLAIIDFLLFDYEYKSTNMHAIFATFPAVVYAFGVIIAGYAGVRWGEMAAPYNFLNFIAPTGWFGFDLSLLGPNTLGIGVAYLIVALILIFMSLGLLFLKIKDLRRKYK